MKLILEKVVRGAKSALWAIVTFLSGSRKTLSFARAAWISRKSPKRRSAVIIPPLSGGRMGSITDSIP